MQRYQSVSCKIFTREEIKEAMPQITPPHKIRGAVKGMHKTYFRWEK